MNQSPIHTPYRNGEGGIKVGLEPIKESNWLEIDSLFRSEIKLKKQLYNSKLDQVYQEVPESYEAQCELIKVLTEHLSTHYPSHKYQISKSLNPLANAALMVQEDLVLMIPREGKYYLGAASLCAPSNWSLKEKFNLSLMEVHHEVPSYKAKIGSKVNKIFANLPSGRIFQRFNWSIYEDAELFHPAKSKKEIKRSDLINQENAGERLFLRVERQTIRRLPESSSIVFTIRVHIDPLSSIQNDFTLLSDLKMALSHLNADLKTYKSIDQIEMPLQSWLDHRINKLN